MLHWLILIWAVVVLLFCAVAVFLILTRPFAHLPVKPAVRGMTALSTNARLARLLDLALAQSRTDAGFEREARRHLAEDPAFDAETQWVSLLQLMNTHRRREDLVPATRVLAQRLRETLPRAHDE